MQERGTCVFCGAPVIYRDQPFVTYATKQDAHLNCYEKAGGKMPAGRQENSDGHD